jgi:hypothetical protein
LVIHSTCTSLIEAITNIEYKRFKSIKSHKRLRNQKLKTTTLSPTHNVGQQSPKTN